MTDIKKAPDHVQTEVELMTTLTQTLITKGLEAEGLDPTTPRDTIIINSVIAVSVTVINGHMDRLVTEMSTVLRDLRQELLGREGDDNGPTTH